MAKHFPANQVDNALKIMECESQGNEGAIGDGHLTFKNNGVEYGKSYGLFQIRHLPNSELRNPAKLINADYNIKAAAEIYTQQGFKPWTCKKVLK